MPVKECITFDFIQPLEIGFQEGTRLVFYYMVMLYVQGTHIYFVVLIGDTKTKCKIWQQSTTYETHISLYKIYTCMILNETHIAF